MTMMTKILAGAAGLAAIASAAPSTAQYYQTQPYGYGYGYRYNNYGYGMNTNAAVQQCPSAGQNPLYSRGGARRHFGAPLRSHGSAGPGLSLTPPDPDPRSGPVRCPSGDCGPAF